MLKRVVACVLLFLGAGNIFSQSTVPDTIVVRMEKGRIRRRYIPPSKWCVRTYTPLLKKTPNEVSLV